MTWLHIEVVHEQTLYSCAAGHAGTSVIIAAVRVFKQLHATNPLLCMVRKLVQWQAYKRASLCISDSKVWGTSLARPLESSCV